MLPLVGCTYCNTLKPANGEIMHVERRQGMCTLHTVHCHPAAAAAACFQVRVHLLKPLYCKA